MDMLNVKAWEGRVLERTGVVTAHAAAQIGAALGVAQTHEPQTADPLPPLWHWCAFPETVSNQDLGEDGHPRLGDFLPPLRQPRRMWAGGSLSFFAPLRVGDTLVRISTILKAEEKGSAEDPKVFLTVQHNIIGPQGLAIEERQTLVYLNIPETFTPPCKQPMPQAKRTVALSEASLFRFSAVTFNAHRIHYDLAYARNVEKYPGLVVHGPLQAMQLMQLACDERGSAPSFFDFRGVHPMFLGPTLELACEDDGAEGMRMFSGQSGHVGMQARALWGGTL